MNYEVAVANIRNELKGYLQQNSIKALALGVSGGIDSALCCALAKPICDELKIPLIGRSLPIETNKQEEISAAKKIGDEFCSNFETIDLTAFYKSSISTLMNIEPEKEDINSLEFKIRQGNVKARIRMIKLYDLAQKHRGMVLSTDNYTEYLLGFWTIAGDIGNYGMIQNLWKTEVYKMAIWICENELKSEDKTEALNSCIKAVPTDGLGISNSDLDQIGASTYNEVDEILKTWLTKDIDSFYYDDYLKYKNRINIYEELTKYRMTLREHLVIKRYERTHFKRNDPYNIPRSIICE